MRVCVWVRGGCAQKQATVLFRFAFFCYFSTARATGGSLPKWPSSNSSDIFRQLSDSQVWHPQHKAKVKWHRRSHRAGWAGNCQPAAGSNFAATQKVCSSFLYPFIFYSSCFLPFLCSTRGWLGVRFVSDNPRGRQLPTPPDPAHSDPRRWRRRRRQLLLIIKSLSIKA